MLILHGTDQERSIDDELSSAATTLTGTASLNSLDPERAREYHDETLPADIYKTAEFCSMWA